MPVWIIIFAVAWKLSKYFIKLNYVKLKKLVFFIAVCIILCLILSHKLQIYVDYIYMPFLVLDFFLFFLISRITIKKIKDIR
ncbi:hypothetical protein ASC72_17960 [Flavobacterium sp. Root420]|nr:hypothetical protein ASC72_17960 [Flavobacterium sp. Root420]